MSPLLSPTAHLATPTPPLAAPPSAIPSAPAPDWRQALRPATLAWVGGGALVVAGLLNPIFMPSFAELLGRTLFVALVLLGAFTAAAHWHARRPSRVLPRWLAQSIALVAAAPLATLLVYLAATRGDLHAIVHNEHRIEGFIWIAATASLFGLVLALGAMLREREAMARSLQLQYELERALRERQALDARMALLTAQVEPHFLFNTLANVQALVETNSPRAAGVLQSLIAYLRAALPRLHEAGSLPPLDNEIALVRAYLDLMHLRMPDRLGFSVDLPPGQGRRRFPAMALLTLVENAVRHGIDPAEDGGHIAVGGAALPDGGLQLWVRDTGVGLAANARPGTGLANLRERLASAYGPAARLDLSEIEPHGLQARITLPPEAAA